MKNRKILFLIGLMVSSAYVLQRALLVLSGNLDLEDIQAQPQAGSSIFGLDISFSYLGMNIYWPIILGVMIFGYKHTPLPSEKDDFLTAIDRSKIMNVTIVTIIPLFALGLHYFSIGEFTLERLDTILDGCCEVVDLGQGPVGANLFQWVASLVTIILTLLSAVVPAYAYFSKAT